MKSVNCSYRDSVPDWKFVSLVLSQSRLLSRQLLPWLLVQLMPLFVHVQSVVKVLYNYSTLYDRNLTVTWKMEVISN